MKHHRYCIKSWPQLALALVLCVSWPGHAMAANTRKATPSTPSGKVKHMLPTPSLSADLIPQIADPTVSMLFVRLTEPGQGTLLQGGLSIHIGPVLAVVEEVIHGKAFVKGQALEVPVRQIMDLQARDKNGQDQWNNLSLERGSTLVLACAPPSQDGLCVARAGIDAGGKPLETLAELRQCYAIEAAVAGREPERTHVLTPLLTSALQGPRPTLFQFALDFSGRRAMLGRDGSAALLAKVMASPTTLPQARLDIATHVVSQSTLFDPRHHVDHANVSVISALAAGLVAEGNPRLKINWLRLLASRLLSELAPRQVDAAALRIALIHSVKSPSADQVKAALDELKAGASEGDRATAAELLALW